MSKIAKYNQIINGDMNNGNGLRVSIWFAGCEFHCEGCHNSELWDSDNGVPFDIGTVSSLLDMLNDKYCAGLSILGGEPLTEYNRKALYSYLPEIHDFLHKRGKDIWLWTGYTVDEIKQDKILSDFIKQYVDVLITGRYVQELHIDGKYYGSSNQQKLTKSQIRRIFMD